jgi:hypothetical protein
MNRVRVAPDGACLFNSVHISTCDETKDEEPTYDAAQRLREICARIIDTNEDKYTEVYLEKPRKVYIEWILNPATYGGENEIMILANLKGVNISVVSFENFNAEEAVILTYPCEEATTKKIYLLYSGQHFDAVELPASCSARGDSDNVAITAAGDAPAKLRAQRVFEGDEFDFLARSLGTSILKAKQKDLLTRLRIKLKCNACGHLCDDSKDFEKHAIAVHSEDEDYDYMCENVTVEETVAHALDE